MDFWAVSHSEWRLQSQADTYPSVPEQKYTPCLHTRRFKGSTSVADVGRCTSVALCANFFTVKSLAHILREDLAILLRNLQV